MEVGRRSFFYSGNSRRGWEMTETEIRLLSSIFCPPPGRRLRIPSPERRLARSFWADGLGASSSAG